MKHATARELDSYLKTALATQTRIIAVRVVREYRRRNISLPKEHTRRLRELYPEILTQKFRFRRDE